MGPRKTRLRPRSSSSTKVQDAAGGAEEALALVLTLYIECPIISKVGRKSYTSADDTSRSILAAQTATISATLVFRHIESLEDVLQAGYGAWESGHGINCEF